MAPIDPSRGAMQRCMYCGTTLVLGGAPAPQPILQPGALRLEECGPNKIQVIKVIRQHTGLGLKEAKDLSEGTPCVLAQSDDPMRIERFRADLVALGARVSVNAPGGTLYRSAPAATGGHGVFLDDHGPNKIAVIKVVVDHTRCGLREAKDLVESAPCVVGDKLDAASAARLRNDLVAAGARVR